MNIQLSDDTSITNSNPANGYSYVALLDKYDSTNERHKMLLHRSRESTAVGGFWHYKYWEEAYTKAGFKVIFSEGKSAVEMAKKEVYLYDRFEIMFSLLSKMRVIPRKVSKMVKRMHGSCHSYITAEEEELISLNWYYVTQKPE
jgi:hypothetical protein